LAPVFRGRAGGCRADAGPFSAGQVWPGQAHRLRAHALASSGNGP